MSLLWLQQYDTCKAHEWVTYHNIAYLLFYLWWTGYKCFKQMLQPRVSWTHGCYMNANYCELACIYEGLFLHLQQPWAREGLLPLVHIQKALENYILSCLSVFMEYSKYWQLWKTVNVRQLQAGDLHKCWPSQGEGWLVTWLTCM